MRTPSAPLSTPPVRHHPLDSLLEKGAPAVRQAYSLRPPLDSPLCRARSPHFSRCFLNSFVSSGTTSKRSATIPKPAILKIGASGPLFTATLTFEARIPARRWIAPETPKPSESFGD